MAETKNVSRNCSIGNHGRCLGTVIVFPPVDGERIGPCQCDDADCAHAARVVVTSEASA